MTKEEFIKLYPRKKLSVKDALKVTKACGFTRGSVDMERLYKWASS